VVDRRLGGRSLGFGADIQGKKQRNLSELLAHVEPDDLLKFGMIPEFIGRLPIITALEELDESALVNILSTPKNALIKQYRKLFDLDGVNLKFTEGALKAVASEAIRRKAGARGLRSILETAMLDVMYEIPSRKSAREVVISEEVILKKSEPVILYASEKEAEPKKESA
jgi:ATP-dependent Clp protease ATP-binding subunit ClpX